MRIDDIISRTRPRRKIKGVAATLLPFKPDGSIAVEAFQNHLRATHAAGLGNAVNMDTGYINYLSEDEQLQVLKWTREALSDDVEFVAGVYIEGLDGDVVSLYRRKIDQVIGYGGTPILFQTARLQLVAEQFSELEASAVVAIVARHPDGMPFEPIAEFARLALKLPNKDESTGSLDLHIRIVVIELDEPTGHPGVPDGLSDEAGRVERLREIVRITSAGDPGRAEVRVTASPAPRARIESVDLARGIIMIVMALDHVRDFLAVPANPSSSNGHAGNNN